MEERTASNPAGGFQGAGEAGSRAGESLSSGLAERVSRRAPARASAGVGRGWDAGEGAASQHTGEFSAFWPTTPALRPRRLVRERCGQRGRGLEGRRPCWRAAVALCGVVCSTPPRPLHPSAPPAPLAPLHLLHGAQLRLTLCAFIPATVPWHGLEFPEAPACTCIFSCGRRGGLWSHGPCQAPPSAAHAFALNRGVCGALPEQALPLAVLHRGKVKVLPESLTAPLTWCEPCISLEPGSLSSGLCGQSWYLPLSKPGHGPCPARTEA